MHPGERKHPSDIWLILFLAAGIFLWQRTSFPLWMVDVFPNQWGAYCLHTGNTADMYTTLTGCKAWAVRMESQVRLLGLDCELAPFMYPPFMAAALSPSIEPKLPWPLIKGYLSEKSWAILTNVS